MIDTPPPSSCTCSALVPARTGRFVVSAEATGVLGRLLARRLGLRPGSTVAGELTIVPTEAGERWTRRFGTRRWSSICSSGGAGTLIEQLGPIGLVFGTAPALAGGAVMRLVSLRAGRIEVAVPTAVRVTGDVAADATTDVTIVVPLGRCRYRAVRVGER